jgi:hypothetical protein
VRRRLSDVDLTGVHSITDAAVWQLSRGCPFLQVQLNHLRFIALNPFVFVMMQTLRVAWCVNVSDVSVNQLALHCPLLQTLEVGD